jgi:hypothetical protein
MMKQLFRTDILQNILLASILSLNFIADSQREAHAQHNLCTTRQLVEQRY